MVRQLDPDFRVRAVRPSYSPSNRPPSRKMPPSKPAPVASRPVATRPQSSANTATSLRPRVAPVGIGRNSRRTQTAKSKRPYALAAVFVLIVLVGIFGVRSIQGSKGDEANAEATNSQVAGANTVTPKIDNVLLSTKINQILDAYPAMDTGVSVIGLRDGTVYDYGDSAAYYAASVSKLLSASFFLKHVENGDYTLQTKVAGQEAKVQLEKLIVNSDNNAWRGFNDLVGRPELEQFARSYGINFKAEQNLLNAHDTAVFIQKLYQNKILNQADTKLLLGYMNRASTDQYLEASPPDGASVYQKAGWLSDRLHVAGVVTDGTNGYAVAIYSKVNGTYDFTTGAELIKKIQTSLNEIYF